MIEKPIEWRRFEPVELEGEVARTASRRPAIQPAPSAPSLLKEFERVLRENERLQLEISSLRAATAKNGNGTNKYRDELESARAELARIEGGDETAPVVSSDIRPTPSPASNVDTVPVGKIAEVVAGYIFANPTDPHIRLVSDALKARGIR